MLGQNCLLFLFIIFANIYCRLQFSALASACNIPARNNTFFGVIVWPKLSTVWSESCAAHVNSSKPWKMSYKIGINYPHWPTIFRWAFVGI